MSFTPPWKVDAWDLPADFAKIEQQWAPVRDILQDATRFELSHRATSGWSSGEHAGHVVITARSIAEGIERCLAEPDLDRDQTRADRAGALLEAGRLPRGRAKTPPRLNPTGLSREELVGLLSATEAAWGALREHGDAIRACPARVQHFVLGHLTAPEWVRFCAVHTAHHLAIVRDIEAGGRDASSRVESA